jgi:hypothetical protein
MADMKWGTVTEGFQLSASFDQEKILVGRPVLLTLVLANVGDKPLRTASSSKWTDYRFDLRGRDGAKVPLTAFGSRIDEAGVGRQALGELPPGATFVDEILLNRIFDMSIPQKYQLRVERGARKLMGDGFSVVVSNQAEVVIEEEN